MVISKSILVFLALVSLFFAAWAGIDAFADTTVSVSSIGMMGMMGYIFHAATILVSLTFTVAVRKVLTLLLLVWHVPEAILIATMGMGVPDRLIGVAIHAGFSAMALLSWRLAGSQEA